ncbi:unnamed protein product [Danaus chrysippus]|uniref:(African queen) hypothetical protein n=1 Tax=Danaus chrysippus TaxID=151541 RepID=A0A8J2QZN8_9NEOP|nr:unnamed protein product [Danaus chrysippus]
MGHVAQSMAFGGHPEGAALVTRHDQLAGSLARLQRLAASRQAALVESVCSDPESFTDGFPTRYPTGLNITRYSYQHSSFILFGAPGGSNSQQIALRQQALSEAWRSLRGAADLRRKLLHQHLESQTFLSEEERSVAARQVAGGVGAADRLALLPERR